MSETITATGIVATEPRRVRTGEALEITSFRLASSQRRYNKSTNAWEYTDSNWFTVTAFRRLARNAAASIRKGDRVIVTGRMRVSNWKTPEKSGTTVEIDADSLGHDLNWGTATYLKNPRADAGTDEPAPADEPAPEAADAGSFAPAGGSEWYPEARPAAASV